METIFFGFSAVLLWAGFRKLREMRLVKNIPTSKIRSIAMGLVETKGSICETQQPLTSPITKKECVYYSWKIEEEVRENKRTRWRTIRTKSEGNYFWMQDETGEVLVQLKGATIDTDSVYRSYRRRRTPLSPEVEEFLDAQGISRDGWFNQKKLRITEETLYPHQSIYVMGTAKDNPYVEDATQTQGHKDVMIAAGEQESFFFISDKPEHKIIRKMKWTAIALITLGVGMCLFVVWQLL